MRLIVQFSLMLILFAPSFPSTTEAAAPEAASICLNVNEIQRTEVISDRAILFHMRDGRLWRNDLRTACPMLKVSPYTEKLTTGLVCANQQFIRLTLTGDDCELGSFTRIVPQR